MSHHVAYYGVCDDCGRESQVHKTWLAFIDEMAKDGWRFLTQPGRNLCPDCAKNYNDAGLRKIGVFADDQAT